MTSYPRRHSVQSNTTITATGNSGALKNLSFSEDPTVVVIISIQGAVTNGGGNITFSLVSWTDSESAQPISLVSSSALTAATTNAIKLTASHVLEENLQVNWVVTGTTPSYAGVYVDILMPSPES